MATSLKKGSDSLPDFWCSLEQCPEHFDKKIELLCEVHDKLCCSLCVSVYHRQCSGVCLIADKVKEMKDGGIFEDIYSNFKRQETQLNEQKCNKEEFIKNWGTLNEAIPDIVRSHRSELNDLLDKLESDTIEEIVRNIELVKLSVNADIDECTKAVEELKTLEVTRDNLGQMNDIQSFITQYNMKAKFLQFEKQLEELTPKSKPTLFFYPNKDIVDYLTRLDGLGKIECTGINSDVPVLYPDQKLEVEHIDSRNIKLAVDDKTCDVRGICELDEYILLADLNNMRIKILDKEYNVVNHVDVIANPCDMCSISNTEVAMTMNYGNNHEVQFLCLQNGTLGNKRKLQFNHPCKGITYFKKHLYITTGTSLYEYTLDGRMVMKVYDETCPEDDQVYKCAIRPDGQKIFVANRYSGKLYMMPMDGSSRSTLFDSNLINPTGLYFTPLGQLLVCAEETNKIIQVDGAMFSSIATLATHHNGVKCPGSVYYSNKTGNVIVGQWSDDILIIQLKKVDETIPKKRMKVSESDQPWCSYRAVFSIN